MDHRHLSTRLAAFLAEVLPSLSDHWWQTHILDELTFQQRNHVDTAGHTRLDQLDLAALLRIADRNWSEIAHAASLPPTARNWLKEAQTIRNRWAHAPVSGIPDDERYRDLDTIERLMQAIGADQPTLADIHAERTALLAQLAGSAKPADQPSATASQGAFDPGQLVRLKAQPTVTGAVVARVTADPEDRYQVFHDGAVATYYASQIEPAARPSVTPAALHAALTAAQLRHPSIGNLYSLFASRIQFVPYQFRPVIKLIQADRPRLLIADEVGVGKTIEAGLILKELQARRELRTVLVICPKPLVAERKWLEEMKRFDERFDHLDGPTLRYCIEETHLDGVWPQQYARAILPYSLLDEALLMGDTERRRPRRGLLGLDPPPAFDLVIVDEAHHIRNTETWAYRAVRWFCDNAEAVVRIEATPVQLGDPDLYTLLHLLLPDLLPSSRELASRVFGLASYLESILDRHLSQLEYPSRHRPRPRCGSGLDQGPQSWRHWNNERQKALRAPSDFPLRPDRNGHLATPQADAERPHGLKYRLVYIRDRQRIVGYDNERGKGDHKHLAGREEPYTFVSVRTLLDDFWADVRRLTDD